MQRLNAHVARCHRTDAILPSWKPVFPDPPTLPDAHESFPLFPLRLSCYLSLSLFFSLVKFPQDPEKYPLLPCTSEKHYHTLSFSLSRNAPASRHGRSLGPRNRTKNALARPPTPAVFRLSGSFLDVPFVPVVACVKFSGCYKFERRTNDSSESEKKARVMVVIKHNRIDRSIRFYSVNFLMCDLTRDVKNTAAQNHKNTFLLQS